MTLASDTASDAAHPRLALTALWTSTMFVVAFIDIFAFYRADIRAQIEAGRAFVFTIDEAFLLGIVLYVTIPALMIAGSALLPRRINRVTQIVVASAFALTIVGAAIGEWTYYLVASGVELALLAGIVVIAARWKSSRRSDRRLAATGLA